MTQLDPLSPEPMRDAASLTPPFFAMPPGACDGHVHVFQSVECYPHVVAPHYTLPEGTAVQLRRMAVALGIDHVVIVQPSFYGTDNRCLLDTLDQMGDFARGVAMVADNIAFDELYAMHARGIRALRLDLFMRADWPVREVIAFIERSAALVRPLGWHLQFYTPGRVVRELIPFLADLDVDFVIDHMGYMLESDGLTRVDFDRLLTAVARRHGWMKLSGPYRVAKDGNFERLRPLAEAIIAAVPHRTIWGSDWPHIPHGRKDTGELLNLLGEWLPEAATRHRVLVDNPRSLFDFPR